GGSDRFIVVVHPDDRHLAEHLSQPTWAGQVRLAYQERRLGMAHALECGAPLIREDGAPDFVLASCDNLYPEGHVASLVAHRRKSKLDAALTLLRVQADQVPTMAVVAMQDGRVTHIVEKPRPEEAPSDLGVPALYALSTRMLDYLPHVPISARGERDFPDALRLLIEDGGTVGGVPVEWRMTMTHAADLLALNRYFLRHDPTCATVEADLPDDASVIPPVRIEPGVKLGAGCHVGPEVYLEAGCSISTGATLRQAVVLRGVTIEAGAVVEGKVVG
ncbi:MAG: NDP-sugar synthase, partial [Chloroflexi bacterium]|nr:NDP-sugar synthase [Chloroflexota bacterium]